MRADLRALLPLLAVFGVVYATTLGSYGMLMWDEAEYASIGRSVSRGEGFSIGGVPNALRPPVLPLSVAASILMAGSTEDAVVKRPMIVFSLLALAVTFWIGAAVYDRLTGLAAAAILGVCPAFWTSTPQLMTEIPFMALFAAAVACFYFGLHRDERFLYWSWLGWGLAFLTRYTAVLFAPIAALFLILAYATGDADARRRIRSRHMLLAPCVGMLGVAPWLLRQQLTFGDALAGMRQASTQLQLFLPGVSMPWYYYILQMPGWLSPAIAVLLAAGVVWAASSRDRFALHCLAAVTVVFVWMSAYRFKEMRQVTATLPLVAVVAAAGARHAVLAAARPRRAVAAAVVLLMALAGVEFRSTRPVFRQRVTLGYPSFLEAMRFLRAHSSPDGVIIGASVPQIHWYADRRVIDVPPAAQLRETLSRSEWLVLTNFERGQPPYADELMRRLVAAQLPGGEAAIFRDAQFRTFVVRSETVRQHER